MRNILLSVLLFCLAACSQQGWTDRLASPDEQHLAIETMQELRDGDIDGIAKRAEPQLKPDLPRAAAAVRPILARVQGPFEIKTVNVVEQSGGPVTKAFTLQAGSGSTWALAEIVLRGRPGSLQVAGFHAWPGTSDLSKVNDFAVSKWGVLGFTWFLLMFASVATCLIGVVLIWRGRWLKRRWLWTLGSLLGFASFGLNWSTGTWTMSFVNVSLLGATATRALPFGPWILTFGIPVIAIIVIVRWLRGDRPTESAT